MASISLTPSSVCCSQEIPINLRNCKKCLTLLKKQSMTSSKYIEFLQNNFSTLQIAVCEKIIGAWETRTCFSLPTRSEFLKFFRACDYFYHLSIGERDGGKFFTDLRANPVVRKSTSVTISSCHHSTIRRYGSQILSFVEWLFNVYTGAWRFEFSAEGDRLMAVSLKATDPVLEVKSTEICPFDDPDVLPLIERWIRGFLLKNDYSPLNEEFTYSRPGLKEYTRPCFPTSTPVVKATAMKTLDKFLYIVSEIFPEVQWETVSSLVEAAIETHAGHYVDPLHLYVFWMIAPALHVLTSCDFNDIRHKFVKAIIAEHSSEYVRFSEDMYYWATSELDGIVMALKVDTQFQRSVGHLLKTPVKAEFTIHNDKAKCYIWQLKTKKEAVPEEPPSWTFDVQKALDNLGLSKTVKVSLPQLKSASECLRFRRSIDSFMMEYRKAAIFDFKYEAQLSVKGEGYIQISDVE